MPLWGHFNPPARHAQRVLPPAKSPGSAGTLGAARRLAAVEEPTEEPPVYGIIAGAKPHERQSGYRHDDKQLPTAAFGGVIRSSNYADCPRQ